MASQPSLLSLSLVCYSEAVHSALSCLPGVTVVYIHIYLGLLMGGVSSGSPCAAAILHLPPFPVFDFAFQFPRGPVNVNEFVTAAHDSYFFCFMPQGLCSGCAVRLAWLGTLEQYSSHPLPDTSLKCSRPYPPSCRLRWLSRGHPRCRVTEPLLLGSLRSLVSSSNDFRTRCQSRRNRTCSEVRGR